MGSSGRHAANEHVSETMRDLRGEAVQAGGDVLRVLLIHNERATRAVLEACEPLDDAAWTRAFEMGLGSLRATMTHTLGAVRGWTDMLLDQPPRPRLENGPEMTPRALLDLLPETCADFARGALLGPVSDVVRREFQGKPYAFTRGGVVSHVTTHGVHHRAQAINMLRSVGVSPLPEVSVLDWMAKADPVPV